MSCGCEEVCNCAILGTDCVNVVGDGRATSPYEIAIIISPDDDNAVECRANGLFAVAGLAVADTDCIALDGTGLAADPITADLILSPDDGNRLECRANGLYAYPCPEVYCCCIGEDEAAMIVDTANTTYVPLDGAGDPILCQIEVAPGDWRISVELIVQFFWDAGQGGDPIDFSLGLEADYCDPLDLTVNCPPRFRTYVRTNGTLGDQEEDQLLLDSAFDVTNPGPGSLTINLRPEIITGALHTATMSWWASSLVLIVGRVAASQPVNTCMECV